MDPLGREEEDGTGHSLSGTHVEFDSTGTSLRLIREFRHHLLSQI